MKRHIAALLLVLIALLPLSVYAESDYSNHLVISRASFALNSSYDYNHGDAIQSYWSDKYNFEWDMLALDWGTWAETLRVWINSSDMPDMVHWSFNYSELADWADQELIFKFPDDWKERWPNVAATQEVTTAPLVEELLGGTYGLMCPTFATSYPSDIPVISYGAIFMRKDWAEAVGFELKDYYTLTEVYEYIRLVQEQNPGNCASTPTGFGVFQTQAFNIFILPNCASYANFYVGEDGSYVWGPDQPENYEDLLTGLTKWREAYENGYIDKEFYLKDQTTCQDMFYTTGTSAIYYWNDMAGSVQGYNKEFKDNLGLEDVIHCAFIIGEDGYFHGNYEDNFWTMTLFNPDLDEEKFERIMDLMEETATTEGQRLINLGIQGEDWDYDENGEIKLLYDDFSSVFSDKYKARMPSYTNLLVLSDDFGLTNPSVDKDLREGMIRRLYERYELSNSETLREQDALAKFHTSNAKIKLDSIDYTKEFAQLVLMEGDIKTNLDAWLDDLRPYANQVISELNELSNK